MKIHTALSTRTDTHRAVAEVVGRLGEVFGRTRIDLAFLFMSSQHVKSAQTALDELTGELKPAHLVGCTGTSIVGESREIERAPGLAVWAASLPGTDIDTFRLTVRAQDGSYLFGGFPERIRDADRRRCLVLLADPFTTPIKELLDQTNRDFPNLPVIGGLASAGHGPGKNRLMINSEVAHVGVVGVLLSGDVAVDTVVSQGCRPVGAPFLITRVEGNSIQALGRRPAMVRLQEVFDQVGKSDRELIRNDLHIGMAMNEYQDRFERGDFVIRNIMGIDRKTGAIAVMGLPRPGQTMQFHVRDRLTASEDLESLLEDQAAERQEQPRPY